MQRDFVEEYLALKGVTLDAISCPSEVVVGETFIINLQTNYHRRRESDYIFCFRQRPGTIWLPAEGLQPYDEYADADLDGTGDVTAENGETVFAFMLKFMSTGGGNPPEARFDIEFQLFINGYAKAFERVAITVKQK